MPQEQEIKYLIASPTYQFYWQVSDLLPDNTFRFVGLAENVDGALSAVDRTKPDVVLIDKALPSNLCAFARRVRAVHPEGETSMIGQVFSPFEVREFLKAGVKSFTTKPEMNERLRRTVAVAASKKVYFSPEVREELETQGDIGAYLRSSHPQLTPLILRAFHLYAQGARGRVNGINTTELMIRFREATGTKGVFAPFRFAIQTGLLSFVPRPGLVEMIQLLTDREKAWLKEYIRYFPSQEAYRSTPFTRRSFGTRIDDIRKSLELPHSCDLLSASVAAGVIALDEVGTEVIGRRPST